MLGKDSLCVCKSIKTYDLRITIHDYECINGADKQQR